MEIWKWNRKALAWMWIILLALILGYLWRGDPENGAEFFRFVWDAALNILASYAVATIIWYFNPTEKENKEDVKDSRNSQQHDTGQGSTIQ